MPIKQDWVDHFKRLMDGALAMPRQGRRVWFKEYYWGADQHHLRISYSWPVSNGWAEAWAVTQEHQVQAQRWSEQLVEAEPRAELLGVTTTVGRSSVQIDLELRLTGAPQ